MLKNMDKVTLLKNMDICTRFWTISEGAVLGPFLGPNTTWILHFPCHFALSPARDGMGHFLGPLWSRYQWHFAHLTGPIVHRPIWFKNVDICTRFWTISERAVSDSLLGRSTTGILHFPRCFVSSPARDEMGHFWGPFWNRYQGRFAHLTGPIVHRPTLCKNHDHVARLGQAGETIRPEPGPTWARFRRHLFREIGQEWAQNGSSIRSLCKKKSKWPKSLLW
jgi:hypothetical protein